MSPEVGFSVSVGVTLTGLALVVMALRKPLRHVLRDLLDNELRARFYERAFFLLIATSTLLGSLWPASDLDVHRLAARQLACAGGFFLIGLGACALLLLSMILQYEARQRAREHSTNRNDP